MITMITGSSSSMTGQTASSSSWQALAATQLLMLAQAMQQQQLLLVREQQQSVLAAYQSLAALRTRQLWNSTEQAAAGVVAGRVRLLCVAGAGAELLAATAAAAFTSTACTHPSLHLQLGRLLQQQQQQQVMMLLMQQCC
jgi:hypothetical protein